MVCLGMGVLAPNRLKTMENHNGTSDKSFHLGRIIKTELVRQGRSITWLAQQIGCTRENLYQLFRNRWIHAETLFKIGMALDFDFFKLCSDFQNAQKTKKNLSFINSENYEFQ